MHLKLEKKNEKPNKNKEIKNILAKEVIARKQNWIIEEA